MRAILLTVALGLAALTPHCADADTELSPAFKVMLAAPIAAHAADFWTTQSALSRPGTREGNPLLAWSEDKPWAMGSVKAGTAALTTWGKMELYQAGHPKWAWTWLVVESVGLFAVAYSNSRQGHHE